MMYDVLTSLLNAEKAVADSAKLLDDYGCLDAAPELASVCRSLREIFQRVQKWGEEDEKEGSDPHQSWLRKREATS